METPRRRARIPLILLLPRGMVIRHRSTPPRYRVRALLKPKLQVKVSRKLTVAATVVATAAATVIPTRTRTAVVRAWVPLLSLCPRLERTCLQTSSHPGRRGALTRTIRSTHTTHTTRSIRSIRISPIPLLPAPLRALRLRLGGTSVRQSLSRRSRVPSVRHSTACRVRRAWRRSSWAGRRARSRAGARRSVPRPVPRPVRARMRARAGARWLMATGTGTGSRRTVRPGREPRGRRPLRRLEDGPTGWGWGI